MGVATSRGAAFSSGVGLGVVRFAGPPCGVGGVGFSAGRGGEPPGVPEGFTGGEAPGVPEGLAPSRFAGRDLLPAAVALGEVFGALGDLPGTFPPGDCLSPSRFGGTGFFPGAAAFGKVPGVTLAFGEPASGFIKLGGDFCPATVGGEPVALGDPATCPLLPICDFTKGVGFGKSFGGGLCSAKVFLSFSAS